MNFTKTYFILMMSIIIGINVNGQNAIVDGKTTTTDFQMINGATSGHILQSDGVGNATWVAPTTLPSDWNTMINVPAGFSDNVDNVNDPDSDPTNEHNTNATLTGTDLNITDGGGTLTVDLSSLQDGVTDADADPTNEYNTSAVLLAGTDLNITDGGGTLAVDLSPLKDNLGNHNATMNLDINHNSINNVLEIGFTSGSAIIDDIIGNLHIISPNQYIGFGCSDLGDVRKINFCNGAMLLEDGLNDILFTGPTPGANFNLNCNNLTNVEMMSFCASGGDTHLMEIPNPHPLGQTEVILQAQSGAQVPLGVGGPVNPPLFPPFTSVVTNAGGGGFPPAGYMMGVYGDAWANDWWALSDAAFKQNIEEVENATDLVKKLRPVKYEFNKERFPEHNFIDGYTYGFLAQELKEVMPEAVRQNSKGFHAVRYNTIIPVLAQAISEMDEKIERISPESSRALQEENDLLKKEVEVLQSRLDKIEEMLASMGTDMQSCCLNSKTEIAPPSNDAERAYLEQNSPNPFYHKTIIQYYLPETSKSVYLNILGVDGKVIQKTELTDRGYGTYTINGKSLTAGTYYYNLVVDGEKIATKQMVLTH